MRIALEARGISKIYDSGPQKVKAVDDVSIEFERGEFVALVGPSGSGKTTMLAMLAGLLSPTMGSIRLEGREYATLKEAQRAELRRQKIGFTFQANNLVGYLTAQENVELMLRLNGQLTKGTRDRARELLVRLGLEDRLQSLPRQLSGGQKQRVAIARSLINNPALVLADEPSEPRLPFSVTVPVALSVETAGGCIAGVVKAMSSP